MPDSLTDLYRQWACIGFGVFLPVLCITFFLLVPVAAKLVRKAWLEAEIEVMDGVTKQDRKTKELD